MTKTLSICSPRALAREDYHVRGRGWSAVGWLLHQILECEPSDMKHYRRVCRLERMLCRFLNISPEDLQELERACQEQALQTRRLACFHQWCRQHGIKLDGRLRHDD